jgi:hypothetical protein
MARYVVVVDGTTIDGLKYNRGTIINVPSSNDDIQSYGANINTQTGAGPTTTPLYNIPRLRFTDTTSGAGFVDLATLPPYLPVTSVYTNSGDFVTNVENQLGLQMSTDTFPPGSQGSVGLNVAHIINEPVLPVANSQYD